MKTKEELSTLREEVETLNKKLCELTEDELAEVTGGLRPAFTRSWFFSPRGAEDRPGQVRGTASRENQNRLTAGDDEGYEHREWLNPMDYPTNPWPWSAK